MEVYESELIEGLLFTTEESKKEFDRLLSSKEESSKFIAHYNICSLKEYGELENLIEVSCKNDKIVIRIEDELLRDNIDLEFGLYEMETYFGNVLDDVLEACNFCDDFEDSVLSILNKNISKKLVYEKIRQSLKSKLIIE